jgi:hypothetical protein
MRFLVGIKGDEKNIDEFTKLLRRYYVSYQRIDITGGELRTESWSHDKSLRITTGEEDREISSTYLISHLNDTFLGVARLFTICDDLATTAVGVAILSAVVVELTKETLKYILNWLREEKKEGSELSVVLKGNVLKLNEESLAILEKILEKKLEALGRGERRRKKRKH